MYPASIIAEPTKKKRSRNLHILLIKRVDKISIFIKNMGKGGSPDIEISKIIVIDLLVLKWISSLEIKPKFENIVSSNREYKRKNVLKIERFNKEHNKNQELLPIEEEISANRKSEVDNIINPERKIEKTIETQTIFLSKWRLKNTVIKKTGNLWTVSERPIKKLERR